MAHTCNIFDVRDVTGIQLSLNHTADMNTHRSYQTAGMAALEDKGTQGKSSKVFMRNDVATPLVGTALFLGLGLEMPKARPLCPPPPPPASTFSFTIRVSNKRPPP